MGYDRVVARAVTQPDDSARRLVELGLAPVEARCYAALLQMSPAPAREVAARAGIPQAKIYSALRALEQRGFCTATSGRITTFRAVEPELALEEWTRAREHERRLATAREQRVRAELLASLPRPPVPRQADNGEVMELLGGQVSTTRGLEDMIARTRRRVDIFNALPVLQPRSRWNVAELAALRRGVHVRMLFSTEALAVEHRCAEILEAGGEVRIARSRPPKLVLRDDGAEAIVALSDRGDPQRPICVAVRRAELVAPLQLLFNREWRRGRAVAMPDG